MMTTHKSHQKVRIPRGFEALQQGNTFHFHLDGLLPPHAVLALQTVYGTLSYLIGEEGQPFMRCEALFTTTELSILLPLLVFYPNYVPNEVFFASFYRGTTKESMVAKSQKHLHAITSPEQWAQEMRPIQGAIGKVRGKLSVFDLEVLTIFNRGYVLVGIAEERKTT